MVNSAEYNFKYQNMMSEKNIKRKNESEIKIDIQNQPKFAKIHKLDVLFAKDKINAKSHDEHECY